MQIKPKFELVQEEIQESIRTALISKVETEIRKTIFHIFEDEIDNLCGNRHERKNGSPYKRAGSESGKIHYQGQQMKVKRPRVRKDNEEVRIESYEALKDYDFLSEDIQKKVIHGISTRDYSEVINTWDDGLKLTKSSVSRAFKRASQKELDSLNGRDLSGQQMFAVMIDGIEFSGITIVVAMGFTTSGKKEILGLIEGATENSHIVKDLFSNLLDRGLTLTDEILFVLDGAKALKKAVKDSFGSRAVIQRCQVHKIRNVQSYLPKRLQGEVKRRLKSAYGMTEYSEALKILQNTVLWLHNHSENAANSLREGLEETITIHRLQMPSKLRTTFSTTNPIESMFDKVKSRLRRVKNWKAKGQASRWTASSLLLHEKKFRTIKGYREIPLLIQKLKTVSVELDTERKAA